LGSACVKAARKHVGEIYPISTSTITFFEVKVVTSVTVVAVIAHAFFYSNLEKIYEDDSFLISLFIMTLCHSSKGI